MFGSNTPLAERPDWHPVHRASVALRAAISSSTAYPPKRLDTRDDLCLSNECGTLSVEAAVLDGLVDPSALAHAGENDDLCEGDEDALLLIDDDVLDLADDNVLDLDDNVLDLDDNVLDLVDDDVLDLAEPEAFVGDATADLARAPRQAEMQALVADFYRRQRQVSLLVACCIGTAALVTVSALLLLASVTAFATPEAAWPLLKKEDIDPRRSTSIAWQRPHAASPALLQRASFTTNSAQAITVASGGQIAFGSLLPRHQGRYLLLRGLPSAATLSAGLRNPSGAWIVKAEDIEGLTLHVAGQAEGTYPLELYQLGTGDQISARQSFVLNIQSEKPRIYAAGLDAGITTLLDMAVGNPAAAQTEEGAPEPSLLLTRAARLAKEGDIAGAALLLNYLAAHGQAEAATALARKLEQTSSTLGARAQRASQRAAADTAAGTAERMKILASLSGRTPAD